jgi:hypothetical protein
MSTLDASPKGAGRAHLSAPAVIVIGDFDCGRIEKNKTMGMDPYMQFRTGSRSCVGDARTMMGMQSILKASE